MRKTTTTAKAIDSVKLFVKIDEYKFCLGTQEGVSYSSIMQSAHSYAPDLDNMDIYLGALGYRTPSDNLHPLGHLPWGSNIKPAILRAFFDRPNISFIHGFLV